jgi:hypothetical protein
VVGGSVMVVSEWKGFEYHLSVDHVLLIFKCDASVSSPR